MQDLHAAGVRGVRFNFVKRLVDFTPKDVGPTRRFNAGHQWVHQKIQAREFNVQQLDAAG